MPSLFDTEQGIGFVRQLVTAREQVLEPLRDRQDFDFSIYLLHDPYQERKPLGMRSYISNEPQTAVDTAHAILTRNPERWQIALEDQEQPDKEYRRLMSKFERLMAGIMADFNESNVEAGGDLVRKEAAWFLLLRGWVACKVVGSKASGRENPMVYVSYDPRFVTPWWNGHTLSRVVARSLAEPDEVWEAAASSGMKEFVDMSRLRDYLAQGPIWKYEYWDLERTGSFYDYTFNHGGREVGGLWAQEPYDHGCMNTIKRLPWYIAPVNGLPFQQKPIPKGTFVHAQRNDFERTIGVNPRSWRYREDTWAERGRSILSGIEETYAQFNEAVATWYQSFSLNTFGTWFIRTATGEVPAGVQEALGTPTAIGLKENESVQHFVPQPVNQDAVRFFQVVQDERESATLRKVLEGAVLGERMSGFLHSRQEGAALNALEPWITGMNEWASHVGQLVFDHLYFDKALSGRFSVAVADQRERTFTVLEFDPKELRSRGRRLRVRGTIEPAVPQDLTERLTVANLARQGATPLLSRRTIYDKLLPMLVTDPDSETERVFEDLADTEPTVLLLRIAEAFERLGESEMAAWFRDRHNQRMVLEGMQLRQLLAGMGGGATAQGNFPGPGAAPPPQVQPPEMRGEGRASP